MKDYLMVVVVELGLCSLYSKEPKGGFSVHFVGVVDFSSKWIVIFKNTRTIWAGCLLETVSSS